MKKITDMTDLSKKYVKLEAREHVLQRPGMYVGSIEPEKCTTWVYDNTISKIVKREIDYVPGLYKIFDEILTNAIDHSIRPDTEVKNIKVVIDIESGVIEVFNDGSGIEVEVHPEHGVYVPELIFGHMLTSANYNDEDEDRMVGGMNGLGAKCCNIFSQWFEIDTVDGNRKKHYKQKFQDNMSTKDVPTIKSNPRKPYTKIRFLADFARFGCNGLTQDMVSLFSKRVCDACALTPSNVNVWLNGSKLEYKSFERYVDLYLGAKADFPRVYEKINERWEVIVAISEDPGLEQVSFVNGIWTLKGGKHVDHLVNQFSKKVAETIQTKRKLENVKPQFVRERTMIFIKCSLPNPSFDSQSKETLTTPVTKFGCRPELSDAFIDKVVKTTRISEIVTEAAAGASAKAMSKSDGNKRNNIRGIPKLHDATWAGTSKSKDAVLCLVEGDSAATMAIAGRSAAKDGAQKYGVFALKGKLLNTRDATAQKIADNAEISSLKKIIGLQTGRVYQDTKDLRYGSILVLTDADADGVHIQGLLLNLLGSQWPSLLSCSGFLRIMRTPIVKVSKTNQQPKEFYDLRDFESWRTNATSAEMHGASIKYYKGLATSTPAEGKAYFKAPRITTISCEGTSCMERLDLAFNKKRSDERKTWLEHYDSQAEHLDLRQAVTTIGEFVDKGLIQFSVYDVARSLPSMVDGLKISTRKILHACLRRNLTKEIRVAQLSGHVSEATLYHHGEYQKLQMG
jgi:DNA topoisomerase-2